MTRTTTYLQVFDFKEAWTETVLEALEGSIRQLATSGTDGLTILEHAEEAAGLGFVAIQAYMTSAAQAFRALRADAVPLFADRRFAHPFEGGPNVTIESVVWHMANYYKHHDQWTVPWGKFFGDDGSPPRGWNVLPRPAPSVQYLTPDAPADAPKDQPHAGTISILRLLGLNSLTEFPCLEALCALQGLALPPVDQDEYRLPPADLTFRSVLGTIVLWREKLAELFIKWPTAPLVPPK